MAVLGLSGHLLSRYIVHLGLKNTPGLIFEVPGPQNPVKKLILRVFPDWFRTNFRTGCWTSLEKRIPPEGRGAGGPRAKFSEISALLQKPLLSRRYRKLHPDGEGPYTPQD